jgi:hypothetical protein
MVNTSNKSLLKSYYPRLYHMSHEGAWPSIERIGLLSTTALLDLFEVTGSRRYALEETRRSKSEPIAHPKFGQAMLRDQQPINEGKLAKALRDGLTPRDWYRILNGRVFFWGPESRLRILQGAKLYESSRQTVIEIDTEQFLNRYAERVSLCRINSGATQPMAWERGKDTFVPLDEYPLSDRRKRYGLKSAVAEVTVDYAVPDLREFVVSVYEAGGQIEKKVLWARQ